MQFELLLAHKTWPVVTSVLCECRYSCNMTSLERQYFGSHRGILSVDYKNRVIFVTWFWIFKVVSKSTIILQMVQMWYSFFSKSVFYLHKASVELRGARTGLSLAFEINVLPRLQRPFYLGSMSPVHNGNHTRDASQFSWGEHVHNWVCLEETGWDRKEGLPGATREAPPWNINLSRNLCSNFR